MSDKFNWWRLSGWCQLPQAGVPIGAPVRIPERLKESAPVTHGEGWSGEHWYGRYPLTAKEEKLSSYVEFTDGTKLYGEEADKALADYTGIKVFGEPSETSPQTGLPRQGVKFDQDKLRFELLPTDAVGAIVKILTFGAKKYTARNWESGMDWSRVYGALQRHLNAWFGGEGKDAETGYSHLWHAGCCILFLIAYEIRGIGQDDRPLK